MISTFDLFKIGIGPSSSHTVGPMLAARRFVVEHLQQRQLLKLTKQIEIELYGSLAHTGKGHGTDRAIALGLEGHYPDQIDPGVIPARLERIEQTRCISLLGQQPIAFSLNQHIHIRLHEQLDYHTNAIRFRAYNQEGSTLASHVYYSIGGGFLLSEEEIGQSAASRHSLSCPYPFTSAAELMNHCQAHRLTIAQLMLENEKEWLSLPEIQDKLCFIWTTMQNSVKRGLEAHGQLPGQLSIQRRAPHLYRRLLLRDPAKDDPLFGLDWVNAYALAVSEENAAGGRIVTAPTNGAAGIIPAVLKYLVQFSSHVDQAVINDFLLTSAAIGILYKQNASISGAEVGCQGEIGVACSMAAAGLAAALGGKPAQVENAAEIGMEHHLGLTCDPVAGLVQIPCIERNAMGAVKAINAARIAIQGDGQHAISLDKVMQVMQMTGKDMLNKYKETSQGGLAVSLVGC